MNTEQLKRLAERASTIEDRTATRLPEVHERIAAARRRRVLGTVAGAAGLVVALVLGVQLITDAPNQDSPDPAPDSDARAPQPEPGTCWMASEADILNGDFRIAESEPVPCTEPHNLETAQLVPLSEPTVEEAKADVDLCWEYVREYIGVDPTSWIPWGLNAQLPSQEQIDAGASWMRCDAYFPTTSDSAGVRTSTSSAAGVADNPPVAWMACLDQHPRVIAQPFVPCDRPHLFEQTGMLAAIPDVSTYPSPAQLRAEEDQCLERVTEQEQAAGVGITVSWDPVEGFEPGADIFGACFKHHEDGTPLPPRG